MAGSNAAYVVNPRAAAPRTAAACHLAAARCPQRRCHRRSRGDLAIRNVFSTQTRNPALTSGNWQQIIYDNRRRTGGLPMTVDGTVHKTALMLLISTLTAAATWAQIFSGNPAALGNVVAASKVASVVAIGSAIGAIFKPQWSPQLAMVYAPAKGIALATLTAFAELMYPGLAINAFVLTFSTAASLLFAYKARIITVTDRFADAVRTVCGGYVIGLLAFMLLGAVGVRLPNLFSQGPFAIGMSLISAGLAAANLLIDFRYIQQMAAQRVPQWMEWYSAMSLMMTLVWMYTELLRLLMLLGGRQND